MTYLLTFLLIVCLFYLIKKQLKIKKQNRAFMQLELEKGQVHSLLKRFVFDRNIDTEIAVFEYFKQTGLGEDEHTKEVAIYDSLAKHFENQQKQRI